MTVLEQCILGADHRQHFALFVADLDLAIVERAAMENFLSMSRLTSVPFSRM